MSITHFLQTPIGCLALSFSGDTLHQVELLYDDKSKSVGRLSAKQQNIVKHIERYFKKAEKLTVPFAIKLGTPFQQRVWQALLEIPLGQTRTYGELAKKLKTSARAIGMACRTNPIALIVPCHRVVAANDLGGFGGVRDGKPVKVKQWLLAHEARTV
ncbi:MAG: methylated-DNA--[protein]-cysteine S-methyltransferase [Candidatus Berkiella sp.]